MVYMPGTHVSTMLRHGSETGPERVPVKQVRIRHTARVGGLVGYIRRYFAPALV